jgi:hypothetical protein
MADTGFSGDVILFSQRNQQDLSVGGPAESGINLAKANHLTKIARPCRAFLYLDAGRQIRWNEVCGTNGKWSR